MFLTGTSGCDHGLRQGTALNTLNFNWIIDGRLAGHAAPVSQHDIEWLKAQGVMALVRMAAKTAAAVRTEDVEKLGLWDRHVPVSNYTPPTSVQIDTVVRFINAATAAKRPVGVSCGAHFLPVECNHLFFGVAKRPGCADEVFLKLALVNGDRRRDLNHGLSLQHRFRSGNSWPVHTWPSANSKVS